MGVNKVVFGAVSIMDISDSTVTPETLGEGVTAYDKSGEKITGTMKSGIDTSDATATASDMPEGVTAYVNGEKITGALPEHLSYNSPINTNYKGPLVIGTEFCIEGYIPEDSVIRKDSVIRNYIPLEILGDATAADVAAGKTFTSAAGSKASGTFSLDTELSEQDSLISQIQTALQGKAGGGGGGGSGGATTGTATATASANSLTISFTGLTAQPKMFSVVPKGNISLSSSTNYALSVAFDGTNTIGTYPTASGASWMASYTVNSSTTAFTWEYSDGTLTITASSATVGGYFKMGVEYQLAYAT